MLTGFKGRSHLIKHSLKKHTCMDGCVILYLEEAVYMNNSIKLTLYKLSSLCRVSSNITTTGNNLSA